MFKVRSWERLGEENRLNFATLPFCIKKSETIDKNQATKHNIHG
jgi:hypothetical protein